MLWMMMMTMLAQVMIMTMRMLQWTNTRAPCDLTLRHATHVARLARVSLRHCGLRRRGLLCGATLQCPKVIVLRARCPRCLAGIALLPARPPSSTSLSPVARGVAMCCRTEMVMVMVVVLVIVAEP